MEKDNKKARDDARKEYNDTVRSLALFARKRDPRYKAHLRQSQLSQLTQVQAQARSGTLTPSFATALPKRVVAPASSDYIEQDWQKIHAHKVDNEDDLEWAAAEGGEDPEEWECVACGKTFRSEAAWDSHERSKKHMKEVDRLRREMAEDEEELGLGDAEPELLDLEPDSEGGEAEDAMVPPESEISDRETDTDADPPAAGATETPFTVPKEAEETPKESVPAPAAESELDEDTDPPVRVKGKKGKATKGALPEPLTKTEKKSKSRSIPMPNIEQPDSLAEVSTEADTPTASVTADPLQSELSKREKRKLREAKKALEGDKASKQVLSFHSFWELHPTGTNLLCRYAMFAKSNSIARRNYLRISTIQDMLSLLGPSKMMEAVGGRRARKASGRHEVRATDRYETALTR